MEQRLEALERQVFGLTKRAEEVDARVTEETSKVRQELQAEAQRLGEEIKRTQAQLDEAVVGGIHIEWAGLILFLFGLWLATASPEFAQITSWLLGGDPSCAPLGLR